MNRVGEGFVVGQQSTVFGRLLPRGELYEHV